MRVQTIIGQTSATNNRQNVKNQPQKANDPIAFGTRFTLSEYSAKALRQTIKEFSELNTSNKPEVANALETLGKHVSLFVRRLAKDMISHNANEANHLFTKSDSILDDVYIRFDDYRTPIAKLADAQVIDAAKNGFICRIGRIDERSYRIKVGENDKIFISALNRVGGPVDDVKWNLITYHDKELSTDKLLKQVTQTIPPKVEEPPMKKTLWSNLWFSKRKK